jgi:hypothetical protein
VVFHGWHRQELPVAEGQEVINEIKPVVQLLLLLLRNPGNKLPGLATSCLGWQQVAWATRHTHWFNLLQ